MSAKHTMGPWEPCILDRPLDTIPEYVGECIAESGGEDFYFVKGTDERGNVDVCHVGNGPRGIDADIDAAMGESRE